MAWSKRPGAADGRPHLGIPFAVRSTSPFASPQVLLGFSGCLEEWDGEVLG